MIRRSIKDIFSRASRFLSKMAEPTTTSQPAVTVEKRKAEPDNATEGKKPKREKRKKVALLTVYSGKGFYGVQMQKTEYPTIEASLVEALAKSQLIEPHHVTDMGQMWFQRASRTDKGVSAAGQVFSLLVELINSNLPETIRVVGIKRTTKGFDAQHNCSHRTYEYLMPTFAFAPVEKKTTEDYRITDEVRNSVNRILKRFEGTRNFYNFTSRRKSDDKSTMRYIISFEAGKPFVKDGLEFILLTVKGQSFMLHQIRKMIGLTIAIVRGVASEDIFDICWAPSRVDIPKAPGLGLLLDKLHYDGYNKRFGNDGIHEPLDWNEYKDVIEKFKFGQIYADIMKTEREEKSMWEWIKTLELHSYQIDLRPTALKIPTTEATITTATETTTSSPIPQTGTSTNTQSPTTTSTRYNTATTHPTPITTQSTSANQPDVQESISIDSDISNSVGNQGKTILASQVTTADCKTEGGSG